MKRTWTKYAAAALFFALAASASADEFVNLGIGGGGGLYTPVYSPHDPQLMMVSCDMGGVYISRDSGTSWRMIDHRQLSNARQCKPLFDPNRPQVIYAASGSILKVSEDAGETWKPVLERRIPWEGETVTHIAMPSTARKVMYVGTNAGLYRSKDDGEHWTKILRISGECGGIVALSTHAYAAFGNVLLHSIDGGISWEPLDIPSEGGRILSMAGGLSTTGRMVIYAVVEGKGLFGTEDKGRKWYLLLEEQKLQQVAMASNQVAVCYAAGFTDVWRTTNSGAAWEKCFLFDEPGGQANVGKSWVQTELKWGYTISAKGLGVCDSNQNIVVLSTQGDLYQSRNGGTSWYQCVNRSLGGIRGASGLAYSSIGLEVTSAWQYLISPCRAKTHYIAFTDIGFVLSPNRGKSWVSSSEGSPWRNTFYEVVFDPFKVGRMYAAASNQHDIPHWTQIDHVNDSGGVVVSGNHGEKWRPLSQGLPEKPCTSLAIDPESQADSLTMYAALYGDGVYKSENGGRTWQRKSEGLGRPGNNHVFMVKVQPGTGRVYASVTGAREGSKFPVPGGLWVSLDRGEYWNDLTRDMNLHWAGGFDFDPRDPEVIYLTASTIPGSNEGGLYKTTDGGKTWKRLLRDEDFAAAGGPGYVQSMFVTVSPHYPDLVYLSTVAHGLWLSRDSGETWEEITELPFASISRVCFAPLDTRTIYVTTFGGGVWKGPAWPGAKGDGDNGKEDE